MTTHINEYLTTRKVSKMHVESKSERVEICLLRGLGFRVFEGMRCRRGGVTVYIRNLATDLGQ